MRKARRISQESQKTGDAVGPVVPVLQHFPLPFVSHLDERRPWIAAAYRLRAGSGLIPGDRGAGGGDPR